MNRFPAYGVIALATVLGGGSILLFGAFLIVGPFSVMRFEASEGQVLIWNGFLFNVLWTFWIILGWYLEEKDIVADFGERYRHYQKTVPMLLPWKGPVGRGLQSP